MGHLFSQGVGFSSATEEWGTPNDLWIQLDAEFGFELDVCATAENARCSRYYTREQDGLEQPWEGVCWCNPPYGREIGRWVRRAYESSLAGGTVVCLVPARTDTGWWHDWAMKGEIRFIRGRLKFVGGYGRGHNAPFPSAVVIYRP